MTSKGPDSEVQCPECGTRRKVNFSGCFRVGWPECCGFTMTLMRSPYGGDEMMTCRVYGLDADEEQSADIMDNEE